MAKALRVSFRPKPEPTPSWSASARARTVASSLRRVSSWPATVSAAWSALAFLYQHLYAAACLLNSGQTGAISVAVERDEDIEQVTSAGRTYIQVKTRGQAIMPADIKSALERFDALRQEHAQGSKPGRATFVVVVNRALGRRWLIKSGQGNWQVMSRSSTQAASGPPCSIGRSCVKLYCCKDADIIQIRPVCVKLYFGGGGAKKFASCCFRET